MGRRCLEGERDCNLRLQLGSSLPSSRKPPACSLWTQHHLHRTQIMITVSCRSSTRGAACCFFLSNTRDRVAVNGKYIFSAIIFVCIADVKSPAMVQNKEIRVFASDSPSRTESGFLLLVCEIDRHPPGSPDHSWEKPLGTRDSEKPSGTRIPLLLNSREAAIDCCAPSRL